MPLGNPLAVDAVEGFNFSDQLGGCERLLLVRQGHPQVAKFSERGPKFRIIDPLQRILKFVSFLSWVPTFFMGPLSARSLQFNSNGQYITVQQRISTPRLQIRDTRASPETAGRSAGLW